MTQNGSDLWLSYWVSHTHEERIEGTLMSTASSAWRNPTAAPDAVDGWQQHTPWLWMSMAGEQSAGGQVSQCCLWAQPDQSGVAVEHAGNAGSSGSRSSRTFGHPEAELGFEEGPVKQEKLANLAHAGLGDMGSRVRKGVLRGVLGVGKAAGVAPAEGSVQERDVRHIWQELTGRAWRLWVGGKRLLRELRPDVQLYLSVLLLLAAANSLFILVGTCSRIPHTMCPHMKVYLYAGRQLHAKGRWLGKTSLIPF